MRGVRGEPLVRGEGHLQAVIVSTSGYFFHLCLRVGGVILLPMLVHGL
ncbi:hypothetical protein OTB20_11605 [Streptomyces sp. H27-H1]|nr:hypothetical protein [Streptomyces sp. H27-H1]MCY0926836.1 hypothetical protein [Streptomyces sp. H27-H1]